MAGSNTPARPTPRLYLAVPTKCDVLRFAELGPALTECDVAAVLLRLPPGDPRSRIDRIKAFASPVQASGAALLVDSQADLVARGGADGAHLDSLPAFKDMQSSLQPQRIAGVGGLSTRHDAMLAGEAGADYVLFGEPEPNGRRPAIDAVVDRVAWWAELFEIPCAAYAGSIDEIAMLAAAGADFIMVEDCVWTDQRGPAAALMDAAQAFRQSSNRMPAAESR